MIDREPIHRPTDREAEVLADYEDLFAYYDPERDTYMYACRKEHGRKQAGDDAYKPARPIQRAIEHCRDKRWLNIGYMGNLTPAGRAVLARWKKQNAAAAAESE